MLYRLLSICERSLEVKGFLTSPQIMQELVLLHLVHEIETGLYCVASLPLEVTYKEDLGWLNNGLKSQCGQESRLKLYVSLHNFWSCWQEEEERLNMFLLYWQSPCCVVVDCSWPIACKFTGNTQHVVMDDESCFVQLTDRIPTDRLVLDYSEVFYQNGWGWRDPPSYVLRRMHSHLKLFSHRCKQATNHHI